jgi:hypothetical protein
MRAALVPERYSGVVMSFWDEDQYHSTSTGLSLMVWVAAWPAHRQTQ